MKNENNYRLSNYWTGVMKFSLILMIDFYFFLPFFYNYLMIQFSFVSNKFHFLKFFIFFLLFYRYLIILSFFLFSFFLFRLFFSLLFWSYTLILLIHTQWSPFVIFSWAQTYSFFNSKLLSFIHFLITYKVFFVICISFQPHSFLFTDTTLYLSSFFLLSHFPLIFLSNS